MKWIKINPENKLPDDFLDLNKHSVNREKYVIEAGQEEINYWASEYLSPVTLEIIGAVMVGSKMYCDIRYRERTPEDKPWDKNNTLIAKIFQSVEK